MRPRDQNFGKVVIRSDNSLGSETAEDGRAQTNSMWLLDHNSSVRTNYFPIAVRRDIYVYPSRRWPLGVLSCRMIRYHAQKAAEGWSIFDGLTSQTLSPVEAVPSQAGASVLSDLLNTLDQQQDWRREPRPAVGA